MRFLYRLLDSPAIYRLSQWVLAPGGRRRCGRKFRQLLEVVPPAERILDVGCGPASVLWPLGLRPTGLDLSDAYTEAYRRAGGEAVTASAEAVPFPDDSFDGVWTAGLMHHLPDQVVRRTVGEMIRVCSPGGWVVIVDNLMPEPAWRRPLAWLVRKMDRGRFVRHQRDLERLLVNRERWRCERFTYTVTGLEALACTYLVSGLGGE